MKGNAEDLEFLETYLELGQALWNDWPLIYKVLLGHEVKKFHREWVDFQLNNRFTLILGPRGFGKTQVCVKDYAILKSLRSRDERILILGKTLPQARGSLKEIRFQLEQNKLTNIFGTFFQTGEKKTGKSLTELFFTGRTKIFGEPNISALGIGGSVISRHFTIILADDLVDSSNAEGKNAELTYAWVKEEVMPMLLPGGEFHIIGSSWAEKDLYHRIIKEVNEGQSDFKYRIYTALDKDGNSIWPEWVSTENLEAIRMRMGEAFFAAQFLNDVRLLERGRKLFRREDVQIRRRSEVMRRVEKIVVGVDPATGESESWTGICVLARVKEDPDWPRFWILDLFKERFGSSETISLAKAIIQKYSDVEIFVVEANGFQKDLANRLEEQFPVEERYTQESKNTRVQRVGALFQQGAVGCVEESLELMEDFWKYSGTRLGTDLIDAFDDAWMGLVETEGEGDYEEIDLRTEEEIKEEQYVQERNRVRGVLV